MSGDFSRLTWDRRKHYTAVLMQQGRLQVDADWNEQIAIIMHRLQTEVADYVGHSGVPAREPGGFQISLAAADAREHGSPALRVGAGRIYVEGRLIENEDSLDIPFPSLPAAPEPGASYIVYLDTWPQPVTFVEDPGIREVALGGPDTAIRLRNAWQVRAELVPGSSPGAIGPGWQPARPAISSGLLNARVSADLPVLENQLYRVEIYPAPASTDTVSGPGTVSFTWSRDNGSLVAAVTGVRADQRSIAVEGAGKDGAAAFATGQWIEVLTSAQVGAGERGTLVQVQRADAQHIVITAESWPWAPGAVPALSLARGWDNNPTGWVTAPVGPAGREDGWTVLENGIEVQFSAGLTTSDGGGRFVPGDYWLIPARYATASIEWPADGSGPVPQPARGVHHAYAALALLTVDSAGDWSLPAGGDLRSLVSPLDDGFVSQGTAGGIMRGPLTVEPELRATAAGQDLVAVRIAPSFPVDGKQPGSRTALLVTGGPVVLGTAGQPLTATVTGTLSVQGTATATSVRTGSLSVQGTATAGNLSVQGQATRALVWASDTPPDPPQFPLTIARIGTGDEHIYFGFQPGTKSPNSGFLRFGDNSGWKFHIGRAYEKWGQPCPNTDTEGVFVTFTDTGFFTYTSTRSSDDVLKYLATDAPNNTLAFAVVDVGSVYLFWRDAAGHRWKGSIAGEYISSPS